MKVPVSWLKDYVDLTVSVEELAYRLTLAGLEVDRIRYIGIPPGDIEPDKAVDMVVDTIVWDRDSLVLGYIHEVKPHPDADRLVLAMVDYGGDALEQAVTGAPNLFQYVGAPLDEPLAVVFALEGAELLDPYSDEWPNATMTLKPRELRGIENRSMVCSEKEIGLSEFHDGILILDTDLPAGTPIQDVLGDAVIEFELTPNFARAFSMMGIAREVAAVTGAELRHPPTQVKAEGEPIEGQVGLDIREPELNPRFTLALLKGVTVEPSPKWMQRRLLLAGMRPVNNIEDITNYVMLETGQPLHAFDYDILVERADGQTPTIITRLPEPGESLVTLDDVERTLDEFTILVADEAGVLSLGGIMGGDESEIHAGTQTVLLEAAGWNYINIRKTLSAQRERGKPVSSEAGARFSRGVHPAQAKIGLLRAIEIMRQIAGGTIAQGILDDYPAPPEPIVVDLPMSEVERILGIAVPVEDVRRILESLEFGVEKLDDSTLRVTVPEHR
ncbi:MAG: phenylalanine--tRNA ligase subunit beta, partial [Anaerolineae bacterium]